MQRCQGSKRLGTARLEWKPVAPPHVIARLALLALSPLPSSQGPPSESLMFMLLFSILLPSDMGG